MSALSTQSPTEIDSQLADLYGELAAQNQVVASGADYCHPAIGERKAGRRWSTSDEAAIIEARQLHEAGTINLSYRSSIGGVLDKIDVANGLVITLNAQIDELEAEHARRGWSRFFIVQGGHIHSSTNCHSCNWRTQFGWLPDLSGLTEADAVAAHGALLCTFCYPTAPVEWTNGRELEAAAKAADKCPGKRDYDAPSRTGYYSGNWATCDTCHGKITVTSTGKLRAHKPTTKENS